MRRLLIADSQGLYRRGLRAILESAMPALEVLEAATYDIFASLLEQRTIDLALVDTQMAGLASLNALQTVQTVYPDVRFVLLSAGARQQDVFNALAHGLNGFIFKSQRDDEIVEAIADVFSGRIYVPPVLADGLRSDALLTDVRPLQAPPGQPAPGAAAKGIEEIDKLTPRQRDVLILIAKGLPNKEIARRLRISEATTKIHAGALMRALRVRNRTEAALLVQGMSAMMAGANRPASGEGWEAYSGLHRI